MDTHALHVVKKYDRVLISRKMEVKSNTDNYIFFFQAIVIWSVYDMMSKIPIFSTFCLLVNTNRLFIWFCIVSPLPRK